MGLLMMGWLLLLGALALIFFAIAGVVRLRGRFDAVISPADDLRRADDGYRPTLAERDGTGGFL